VSPYRPPRPRSLTPLVSLVRVALQGDGDLLSLLPRSAYRVMVGPLGWSRRQTVIVNAPELARAILTDSGDLYPKSDLMVGALDPLIGDSIFVSSGETWRRQRRMVDAAFTHMRLNAAFPAMVAAVDEHERELDRRAESGEPFSLDLAMSHLTADVVCRATFSTSLESRAVQDVFEAFAVFERSVAQVELKRLIFDPAWTEVPQKPEVLEACRRIRSHLGALLDTHLAPGARYDDIATAVIAARDPDTGEGFTREELIDQLGVFFLAGHETSASALTWAFFLLATQPEVLARLRAEVEQVTAGAPVDFEHTRRLGYVRNVFRETLRLYPPITFLPRVALRDVVIGGRKVRRGALVMVSPWVMHRHRELWREPDVFDPDRFSTEREKEFAPGAYVPFGTGPRVCVGAAFATTEAMLVLARLCTRYEFEVLDAARVRPAARLTTRPAEQISIRVRRRVR
jgi:cytochrome P450